MKDCSRKHSDAVESISVVSPPVAPPPVEPLPTTWRVSDEVWSRIHTALHEVDAPVLTGRPRVDARLVFDALIYRGRSGLQWNQLPDTFPGGDPLPDDSTMHHTLQHWLKKGVFEALWALLIGACDDFGGVSFEW